MKILEEDGLLDKSRSAEQIFMTDVTSSLLPKRAASFVSYLSDLS